MALTVNPQTMLDGYKTVARPWIVCADPASISGDSRYSFLWQTFRIMASSKSVAEWLTELEIKGLLVRKRYYRDTVQSFVSGSEKMTMAEGRINNAYH
ncbi:hypothetical protein F5Y19DRAFT_481488 [Xylariaceae sp. FL1651]|nr:hypothetical protein F5Y19DRAFT_481488 [Xylariaceae sp. FL1651]